MRAGFERNERVWVLSAAAAALTAKTAVEYFVRRAVTLRLAERACYRSSAATAVHHNSE